MVRTAGGRGRVNGGVEGEKEKRERLLSSTPDHVQHHPETLDEDPRPTSRRPSLSSREPVRTTRTRTRTRFLSLLLDDDPRARAREETDKDQTQDAQGRSETVDRDRQRSIQTGPLFLLLSLSHSVRRCVDHMCVTTGAG